MVLISGLFAGRNESLSLQEESDRLLAGLSKSKDSITNMENNLKKSLDIVNNVKNDVQKVNTLYAARKN